MKIGVGFCLSELEKYSPHFELLNIENPLYPNYLTKKVSKDIKFINGRTKNKAVIIVDGAYIDLNPGTSEVQIRKIVMKKIDDSIQFALNINAQEIVFLSTYIPQIEVDFYIKSHIDNSIVFWSNFAEKYKTIKISLCNTFEYNPEILLSIYRGVNKPNFNLAFDIGHALAYSKIPLVDWINSINGIFDTVYLHSNDQLGDKHLNFDEGCLLKHVTEEQILKLFEKKNIILKSFSKNRVLELKTRLEKNSVF